MKKATLAVLLLCLSHAAFASGYADFIPWSIDPYGGAPAEQDAFYQGNPGILMGRSPWARLFAAWRLLHNLPVGVAAGKTLAEPCCGGTWTATEAAKTGWLTARKAVPGVKQIPGYAIMVYRAVGDFFTVTTCFPDAFITATQTLNARIASYGAGDPWVRAWLDGQDAVFAACSDKAALPPLDPAAPPWLIADRAYQAAALSLYQRQFDDAGRRFDAIAADATSPWRTLAPYLAARAAVDAALPKADPAAMALARAKLAALAPADAFGHADSLLLAGALDYREKPDARRAALAQRLIEPTLPANVAADFKDSRRLGQAPLGEPAYLDWIAVFGRAPDKPEATWFDHYDVDQIWHSDAEALAHARNQWQATHDPAWLIAAMEWSDPSPDAADLVTAAATIPTDHPAFLTALYHRIRLAGYNDPAATQTLLDTALARSDLSLSTRNLLIAERIMVANDLTELARFAPRESPCLTAADDDKGCLVEAYGMESVPTSQRRPDLRFGQDAAAIIDQLPIPDRARLAEIATIPAPLRLDLALTTWVRAVLAQDIPTADRLASALRLLLPQMEPAWKTYLIARPGEDKQFAAWFILAKLPGADVDLSDNYTRPQGSVADFDGHWRDWLYAGANAAPVPPAAIKGDLVCFQLCGPGAFKLHLPAFAAALADQAAKDRGRFQPADAKAARSVWEDVLSYARNHPADPRSPEALYWLVRISHYGTGHNRSSYRAWVLLHNRYPKSQWATASKYFYD